MKTIKIILLFFIPITAIFGQNKKIAQENEVLFKIKNSGINVDGKFKGVSGTIFFDQKDSRTASIDVRIETKTVQTGNNSRDGHLKKKEYFDVETSPEIRFQSKKIEPTKSGYVATGNLIIKGNVKEIKIPFTYSEKNREGVFNGTFVINRLDYGVGASSWILSDNVTIILKIKVSNE